MIYPTLRRFVRLSLHDRMVKHGMEIHDKGIPNKAPVDMSERTMKSLLAQWVIAWCKETKPSQQIVTSWERVLREVPIADLVDAMHGPPRVILLGPAEQDSSTVPLNPHVIEVADEASDHEPKLEARGALQAPVAPAAA